MTKQQMKFSFLIVTLLIYSFGYAQKSEINASKKVRISSIISLFKQKNIDDISTIVNYPLKRENPIPDIKNPKEFKQRFREVFDQTLVDLIAHSKPEQWTEVGWRGIMLDNGIVWIDSDNGKITAINYQSTVEKKLRQALIHQQKEHVHSSLKPFKNPVYRLKTETYLIRIDELTNGNYRYASWKIGKKENAPPDLILNTGKVDFEGSGGNHVITFKNGIYTYKIYRNIIGEKNAPDITLIVEKNNRRILRQDGTLIAD
ncbi:MULTISPECIES: hypothetical protein [unclassified Sphingobacterium]|uniref:hypothetical protein n=1 Tax=unclassified Sphingobacterium TaxID=2609468 RepID=UPI0025E5C405|nr:MULTISPECIES: hypothetical protein [unclassified Sphingobacterium]